MLWKMPKQLNIMRPSSDPTIRLKRTLLIHTLLIIGTILLALVLLFAISVAWYTNVTHTTGLQFRTEAWGFDAEGNIRISQPQGGTPVAPGSSGVIPLVIDNSQETSGMKAALNIDKSGMSAEMQKRLYFYVDAPKTYHFTDALGVAIPSETVSKIYVGKNAEKSYMYELSAGEALTLTDLYYSDAPLKWERVYDLLGYYFLGTVKDGTVTAEEYIRPIEYDLDNAIFDLSEFSETRGKLLSVGTKSTEQFLKEILDVDGYAGTLNTSDVGKVQIGNQIYYKVAVNDWTGYGIWAYLCTYDEILEAMEFDNSAESLTQSMTATLKIVAANTNIAATEIGSMSELSLAMSNGTGRQEIRLTQDLITDTTISLSNGQNVQIDLNGYSIIYQGSENTNAFSVSGGAELSLINGSLLGNASGTLAISCMGGTVSLRGLTTNGFASDLLIDDSHVTADSSVKVFNCTMNSTSTSIEVRGNGGISPGKTRLIVQNSTITSGNFGISGTYDANAENNTWETDIVLVDSAITGRERGVYLPQQRSTTTIVNCTISGNTGMVIQGGTVDVYASQITGTSSDSAEYVGCGVLVDAGLPWSATLILRGTENHVVSEHAYALALVGLEGKGPGKILVEGGTCETNNVDLTSALYTNRIGTFIVPKALISG